MFYKKKIFTPTTMFTVILSNVTRRKNPSPNKTNTGIALKIRQNRITQNKNLRNLQSTKLKLLHEVKLCIQKKNKKKQRYGHHVKGTWSSY